MVVNRPIVTGGPGNGDGSGGWGGLGVGAGSGNGGPGNGDGSGGNGGSGVEVGPGDDGQGESMVTPASLRWCMNSPDWNEQVFGFIVRRPFEDTRC